MSDQDFDDLAVPAVDPLTGLPVDLDAEVEGDDDPVVLPEEEDAV